MAQGITIELAAGGCVNSRNDSRLRNGELLSASGCRLKVNDNEQVHRDMGRNEIHDFGASESIVYMFYATFDAGSDQLVFVTTSGGSSYIKVAEPGGVVATLETIAGTVGDAWHAQSGEEYFIGTDQGNYVLHADGSTDAMGMDDNLANFGTGGLDDKIDYNFIAAAASPWDVTGNQGDWVVYVITEYDSAYDVESRPVAYRAIQVDSANAEDYIELDWDPAGPASSGATDYYRAKVNSRADKLRIYRWYLGRQADTTVRDDAEREADYWSYGTAYFRGPDDRIWTMERLDEVDYTDNTWTDFNTTKQVGGVAYPYVRIDPGNPSASQHETYRKPEKFTMGCALGASLLLLRTETSNRVVGYSPPGFPEYQPEPYNIPFVGEALDEVVGLIEINNVAIAFLRQSVQSIRYLTFEGDVGGQNSQQKIEISSREGCVGRGAFDKVVSEQGQFAVYLTHEGLRATNGVDWWDACPDFTTGGADCVFSQIANSYLWNNPREHRLELFLPVLVSGATFWKRYDFYYHPSHLKAGRFKMMGPHTPSEFTATGVVAGARGIVDGRWQTYYTDGRYVYEEQAGWADEDMVVTTGQLPFGMAHNQVEVTGAYLTHEGVAGGSIALRGWHWVRGGPYAKGTTEAPYKDRNMASEDVEYDETSLIPLRLMGNWIKIRLSSSDASGHAWGPLLLNTKHHDGRAA